MNFNSPRNRIAAGLTGAVVAVICLARMAGFIPDSQALSMKSRADVAETIALGSSALLVDGDLPALESFLRDVANPNEYVESIGIREATGNLAVEIGPHQGNWLALDNDRSNDAQMQVPIYRSADDKWGSIELRFIPLRSAGVWGFAQTMGVGQMFFIGAACFLIFSFILRLVLKHLDPSKAVPKRVRDALDNLAEGLMILDTRHNILLANTAFANVLGVEAEKPVGRNSNRLKFEKTIDDQRTPWETALVEKRPVANARIKLTDSNSQQRSYLVNCSPLLGHKGNYCGVMVTFDDVTQLEQSRMELSEARDAADAANQAKSDFLANMSHEIRTPMNAILGFTDLLRKGMEENPEQRIEYLNTIHSSGNHSIELINDILDLSNVEAGKLDLEVRESCLPSLVHDTINVLSARAKQKNISLSYEIDGQIPRTTHTDSTRIKQVLINLAGNAIKLVIETKT